MTRDAAHGDACPPAWKRRIRRAADRRQQKGNRALPGRHRPVTILLAAVALTWTSAAHAADQVPASTATKQTLRNNQQLEGSIDYPQDVDWTKLTVTPGENYVATLSNQEHDFTELDIYDARKRLIAKQVAENVFPYDFEYRAIKFIAPSTPLFLAYKIDPSKGYYPDDPYPRQYHESLTRSCAHSTKTRCTAEVNVSHTSDLGYTDDANWYKISLKAGQTYTLTARDYFIESCDPTGGRELSARFGINDPNGKVIIKPTVQDGYDTGRCPGVEAPVGSFKAAKTGTYYVVVTTADYSVSPGQGQFTVRTGVVKAARP